MTSAADPHQGILLLLSIGALGLGPLLYTLLRGAPKALRALELLVVAAVGVLIVFEVIPRTFAVAGAWSILAAILGFVFPFALEATSKTRPERVDVILGVVALTLHTAFDGAALGLGDEHSALPLAVVLHRLPVGLFVWLLIRPSHDAKRAVGVLALMAVSTALGFLMGQRLALLQTGVTAAFEAFVGGTLLHVLRGHTHGDEAEHAPAS
jgi:hypothetical protein